MAAADDVEMQWVNAWNEVYEIVADRWDVQCLLPDGNIVDPEVCRHWLQEMVYDGYCIQVEPGWVLGKQGIIASRWTKSEEMS